MRQVRFFNTGTRQIHPIPRKYPQKLSPFKSMAWTGISDTDREILFLLSYDDAVNACSSSHYLYNLCQHPSFWHEKVIRDYGQQIAELKPADDTYQGQAFRLSYVQAYTQNVYHAAFYGYPDELQLMKNAGLEITSEMVSDAAKGGHWNVLNWALENHIQPSLSWLTAALTGGKLDIADWLFEQGITPIQAMHYHAIRHGQVDSIEWLFQKGIILPIRSLEAAAKAGQLEILRYLAEAYGIYPNFSKNILNEIAINGHVDLLKWLRRHHRGTHDSSVEPMVQRILALLKDPQIEDREASWILTDRFPPYVYLRLDVRLDPYSWDDVRKVLTDAEYQEVIQKYEEILKYI